MTASGSPGFTFETCFCKVIIVKASLSDDFVPFGKTNVLGTLTYKVEQWWTSHVWPSGWVVQKVANGPGFEPSAKGGVSSKRA